MLRGDMMMIIGAGMVLVGLILGIVLPVVYAKMKKRLTQKIYSEYE